MDNLYYRYSIALLSLAKEEDKVDEYLKTVLEVKIIFQENSELINLLKNYGISLGEKKEIVNSLFKGKISQEIINFINIIIDNHRSKYLIAIFDSFIKLAYEYKQIKIGLVYSSIELTKEQIESIEKKVAKVIKCQKVMLDNKIDKSLIGGIKIQVDDMIIDESIKTKLDKLKINLLERKGDNNEN